MKASKSENPLSDDVRKYWESIRYYKGWVTLSALGMILTAAVVISLLPNRYQASTTVMVESQKIPSTYVQETVQSKLTDQLSAIKEEVLSATALQKMIMQYNLYPNLRSLTPDELIEHMRQDITIEVKYASGNGPGAFSVTYQGNDPQTVATVANRLASQFVEWNLRGREQLAEGTTQFLGQQLGHSRRSLQDQEDQIRAFKMQHLGELPNQLTANLQAISQLQTALQVNAAALDRLEQEKMLLLNGPAKAQSGASSSTPNGARVLLEREKLQLETQLGQLEQVYSPTFPDVVELRQQIDQVNEKLSKLPNENTGGGPSPIEGRLKSISYEMNRLNDEQKEIQAKIASYQHRVDQTPRYEQEFTELSRNYGVTRKQYDSLLEKDLEAGLAAAMESDQDAQRFSVLDPARVPEKPFQPKRLVLMLSAAFASLLISMGVAIAKDTFSSTFKREDELKKGLPASVMVVALVSRMETPGERQRRRRSRFTAVLASLIACLVVAAFIWRIHPVL